MNDKHWSERGQNSNTFNDASSKEKDSQEELEKNKQLFREALKQPSPELELRPPWGAQTGAYLNQVRTELSKVEADNKESKKSDLQGEQNKARYREQIKKEKEQFKKETADQEEADNIKRQNAIKTEAERKRQKAQAVLHDQERSNSREQELESYRNQFRQATENVKSLDRDIEK